MPVVAEERVDPTADWATASDLAEFAFCPRAHYYRHHPTEARVAPGALRSADLGREYHELRALRVAERDAHVGRWAAAVLVAILILAVVAWIGGWA